MGLGLSICKLVCNKLGGDIVVSSDNGAKFTFWVDVENLVDSDVYIEPSHRPGVKMDDIELQEIQTKERVNRKSFLMQPDPYSNLLGEELDL